jgi:dolichol-phosphate mannosyltransferase
MISIASPRATREPIAAEAAATPSSGGPELCVVVPTFNERDNVDILIQRLDRALQGIDWEVVFVDDDSPDGTARHVRALAERDRRTRCIRRIGRRGLSSACIEGMLSTSAPLIAVIDGDLQHDESLLPRMRDTLKQGSGKQDAGREDAADVVIASRYVGTGSPEGLSSDRRKRLSVFGARLARRLVKADVADSVSGFFMLRREVVDEVAPRLSGIGTKILIDILASASRPLRVVELPYRFRARDHGESKLDAFTKIEYLLLLAEKVSHRYFPHRMLLFGIVGATGIIVNLAVLRILLIAGDIGFTAAESAATVVAMVSNFFLNNMLTYRDCRLVGWQAVRGLMSFMALCGLGALVNVAVARDVYHVTDMWLIAGIAGAAIGALLNYALTSIFTWGRRP